MRNFERMRKVNCVTLFSRQSRGKRFLPSCSTYSFGASLFFTCSMTISFISHFISCNFINSLAGRRKIASEMFEYSVALVAEI